MLKVLLLIPTLDRSGAEKQFSLLATRLPADEFNVQAVALTRSGPYESILKNFDVPFTVLNKRFKLDPLALWKLNRLIKKHRPDILHTWLFAANAYGRMVAGRQPKPKVIVSERCVDTWKSSWQHWLDRRQIARTTCLVGNSHSVADFYRKRGFPPQRIRVIPNGIEIPEETPIDRQAFLKQWELPPDAKIIGSVGRLARQKRITDLVWAIQLLKQLDDRAYLLLVGEGPERHTILEFARGLQCEQRIRFLGHRDDVPQLLQMMDVFWLASDFEGLSNSIMEAMAARVPVVAGDIAPNRELIEHEKTGFLVRVGDSVGFARHALRLLEDPSLAEKIAEAGHRQVSEHYSVEKMVDAYARLYREIAQKSG